MSASIENQRIHAQIYDEYTKKYTVSNLTEKQLSCGKCNKQYASNAGLFQHKKSVHEWDQYSCNECEYKATVKRHLTRHIKLIHQGQYPCEQCDYKIKRKDTLHAHQLKYYNLKNPWLGLHY